MRNLLYAPADAVAVAVFSGQGRQKDGIRAAAEKIRKIVDRVESRKIPPEKIAALVSKILSSKRPRRMYRINRNPLLLLMNALPDPVQCALIRLLLGQGRNGKKLTKNDSYAAP